ncbi:DegV family protein [Thermocatellispora tengchongensis]|uniref:DegV family protein n=1 Tax=Thermocatellispora tengchongensis TaxID=1073253 RepID=UPI003635292D
MAVIPLQVVIGGRAYDDMADIDPAGVSAALRARSPVTTSRPAPERFAAAYEAAAAGGATAIVSIHLSGEMSGTVEAARLAAETAPIPVEVIDSRSIAMGLGFAVLSAARTAAQGAGPNEVAAAARHTLEHTHSFFYVDTLEHLRRGGRIGPAATLLGSALMIKPLLHIVEGVIVPLEKVRTATRALARLEDLAVQAALTLKSPPLPPEAPPATPKPPEAPSATPEPPTLTPDPSTPTPGPSTPTPGASTPTPDPSTPTPGASTPTPDPSTPTPGASTSTPGGSSTPTAGSSEAAPGVAIAVQHLAARARAEALAERLTARLPALTRLEIVEVGAVIGAHVGPGMLGVTVAPAS